MVLVLIHQIKSSFFSRENKLRKETNLIEEIKVTFCHAMIINIAQCCIQNKFEDNVFSWSSGLFSSMAAQFYSFILFITLISHFSLVV